MVNYHNYDDAIHLLSSFNQAYPENPFRNQINLEIGNYSPFSYLIGNLFVFGYWQSEGVAMPREEAYQELVNNYLPSSDEVKVFTNPKDFPNQVRKGEGY